MGVALYPDDGPEVDTLIRSAETAMQRARERGGDTFDIHSPETKARAIERQTLENALRKALGRFFPDLDTMRLVDFKVRVIDGSRGTAARVRVLIDSRDQDQIWSTIGVSEDIIEASWHALADSF